MMIMRCLTLWVASAVTVAVLSQGLIDWNTVNPCLTWWPLGSNSQPLNTLPFTAICSPSEDGSLVFSKHFFAMPNDYNIGEIMRNVGEVQVAAADPLMPFTGLIATVVHANEDRPWTAGSYETPMAGFFEKNCTDRSSSIMKEDLTEKTVFTQIYNLPPNTPLSDVQCRFMIAVNLTHFWNDVIVSSLSAVSEVQSTEANQLPAEPIPARPLPAGPLPAEPLPAQPLPAEPLPTEPLPAEPLPAGPQLNATELNMTSEAFNTTEPLPAEPLPTEPLPAEPLPAGPQLNATESNMTSEAFNTTEPLPAEPLPVEPLSTEPLPAEPLPAEPLPVGPLPAEPVFVELLPVDLQFFNDSQTPQNSSNVESVLELPAVGPIALPDVVLESVPTNFLSNMIEKILTGFNNETAEIHITGSAVNETAVSNFTGLAVNETVVSPSEMDTTEPEQSLFFKLLEMISAVPSANETSDGNMTEFTYNETMDGNMTGYANLTAEEAAGFVDFLNATELNMTSEETFNTTDIPLNGWVRNGTNGTEALHTAATLTAVFPQEQEVKKNVMGLYETGFWCEDAGSIFTMVPNTRCKEYYIGNFQNSMDTLTPLGRIHCSGDTAFNSVSCACDWPGAYVCPV